MTSLQDLKVSRALTLNAETAADLMTPNPLSIRQNATVKEAAAFLTDRGINAAPVIDDAGRAVGVLSRADIVGHHRQEAEFVPEFYERTDLATHTDEPFAEGFQVENVDRSQVRDIMTPVVLAVPLNDSARKVVSRMVNEKCTGCSWWMPATCWWASSVRSMFSESSTECWIFELLAISSWSASEIR